MNIKQKQHLLAYLGYYVGNIDGVWGTLSETAMNAFKANFKGLDIPNMPENAPEKALKHAVAYDLFKTEPVKEETGTFWDKIEYFDRSEFKCKCGGKYCNGYPAEPDERMVRIADQLRKNLGVPITIVSGLRCKNWNAIQGGVSNSQHMYGEAADIYAKGVSQSRVEQELDKIGGVRYHYAITGSSNVHFDIPEGSR
jgi:peptidoglycan hydrolase-like protein with peptidoglycan-binding domain